MNLKALYEKRAAIIAEMNALVEAAVRETRAMTDEETKALDAKKAELSALDKTIDAAEEQRAERHPKDGGKEKTEEETRAMEDKKLLRDYIRGAAEKRSGEQNLTIGANGAIVPVTIADRIIAEVKSMSPILERADVYREPGTFKVPVWGKANSTHDITVAYSDDFNELVADAGKVTSGELTGYLFGVLTLVGRRLINSESLDIVDFVIRDQARKMRLFLEGELLNGTANKIEGLSGATNIVTTASTSAFTADELIDTQAAVIGEYQENAIWIMSRAAFTTIRKMKDTSNRYLLEPDFSAGFPYRLLGKPVYISDNMPTAAAGGMALTYGDYSGLTVNFREDINLQVLVEKYATQHAIGVVGYAEADGKVTDNQKIAVLKYKAS